MDYLQAIETMSAETYGALKRAIEVGKWPDGRPLSQEQRHNALQAVIAWGELNLEPHQRIGFIDKGDKAGDSCDAPQETPLAWRD